MEGIRRIRLGAHLAGQSGIHLMAFEHAQSCPMLHIAHKPIADHADQRRDGEPAAAKHLTPGSNLRGNESEEAGQNDGEEEYREQDRFNDKDDVTRIPAWIEGSEW